MANDAERPGTQPRRRWTTFEKLRIVEESLAAGANVAEIARRHNISRNMIHRWRHEAKTGTLSTRSDGQSNFALVAVAAESNECTDSTIEVVLRNGRVLRLSEAASPGRAAQLADALEGCRP